MRTVTNTHYGNCYSFPHQVLSALELLKKKPDTRENAELKKFFNDILVNMERGNFIQQKTKYIEDDEE